MSRGPQHYLRTLALALVVAAGASCGGDTGSGVTGPGSPDPLLLSGLGGSSTATLLACEPAAAPQVATALIGPLGGVLAVGNTRVVIPADAVLVPTTFTLTVPASRLVEISVRAGSAEHYLFAQPVLVTIDYDRCADAIAPLSALSVWHIDEDSKSLLERMTSVDLRLLHTITFYTGHLSGYAVAD